MKPAEKWLLAAVLLAGGVVFAKLMYDMTQDVHRMAIYVGELNTSVQAMRADVHRMANTMEVLQGSVQRMDQTIHRGSEQLERWNPMDMMSPRPGTSR
jgi:hypothetical protein